MPVPISGAKVDIPWSKPLKGGCTLEDHFGKFWTSLAPFQPFSNVFFGQAKS
jgi:hypothetical protein